MFSFFPCVPAADGSSGFQRPVIEIPDVITGTCKQGKRLNEQASMASVTRLWFEVMKQVEAQCLRLGTHAAMPRGTSTSTSHTHPG